MIPQEKLHACMLVCDEELTNSSEIELTAKWCILKPRMKGFKKSLRKQGNKHYKTKNFNQTSMYSWHMTSRWYPSGPNLH
jgi:hypothetical protein